MRGLQPISNQVSNISQPEPRGAFPVAAFTWLLSFSERTRRLLKLRATLFACASAVLCSVRRARAVVRKAYANVREAIRDNTNRLKLAKFLQQAQKNNKAEKQARTSNNRGVC